MGIKIYATGKKGLACLQGIEASHGAQIISGVLVGKDPNILNDYSKAIQEFCEAHNIQFEIFPSTLECQYLIAIAAGWQRLIHDVPADKLIVFHDSMLPKYRGFNPLVTALIRKDPIVGVTALRGEGKYDTGAIYLQKSIELKYPTTLEKVIKDVSSLYADLASEIISQLFSQSLIATPQDESRASYSLWRDEEDYEINWQDDAQKIEHFVTCVGFPYNGASFKAKGHLYRLTVGTAVNDVEIANRTPGKIIFFENEKPVVVCGRGLLRLDSFQNEAKDVPNSLTLRTRLT